MKNVIAWKIESGGDFCASGRLFVSLFLHDVGTYFSQLDSGKGVDAVVDAGVAGLPASGHSAVCGVYDCSNAECGDVATPEVEVVTVVELVETTNGF